MIIFISEEYGCRKWLADLNEEEYQNFVKRWQTLRGLNCLVPVTMIIPTAVALLGDEYEQNIEIIRNSQHCHIHESDDSYLEGVNYKIPYDEDFWMDGRKYKRADYWEN
jgi:hypothetical protein